MAGHTKAFGYPGLTLAVRRPYLDIREADRTLLAHQTTRHRGPLICQVVRQPIELCRDGAVAMDNQGYIPSSGIVKIAVATLEFDLYFLCKCWRLFRRQINDLYMVDMDNIDLVSK